VDGAGNIYTVWSDDIRKWSPAGTYIEGWNAGGASQGIAADLSGNLYITDWVNDRVLKYTSSGDLITSWGASDDGDGVIEDGEFSSPWGIAADSDGYIYVTDKDWNRIQKFTSTGTFVSWWGSSGSGDGKLNVPYDVAVDASGHVYVPDRNNKRIQKFAPGPYPPEASFRTNVTSGVAPFAVRFVDTSANMPTAWYWDFGDGTSATDQHPVHTFESPGDYTVQLTVVSRFGSNSTTKGVRGLYPLPYISFSPPDEALIPLNPVIVVSICYPAPVYESDLDAMLATIILKKRDTGEPATPTQSMNNQTLYHRNEFGILFALEKIQNRSYTNLAPSTWYDLYYGEDIIARYSTGQDSLVIPINGFTDSPTDPDSDGLFEDLNANNFADWDDAVVLFWNTDWIQDNEPVSGFDFNYNGFIDWDDAVVLFWEV
jgi:PKD repeat protein